ncbi:MAG: hypothetical protein QOH75_3835 [Actinomycetota bacterium]|nr:hypothetical protein [Actinomycetota bacterium]
MIGAVVMHRTGAGPDDDQADRSEAAAGRMRHQLSRSGAQRSVVTGTDGTVPALSGLADILQGSQEDVLIAAADVVVHDEALADLIRDPRPRSAALVSAATVSGAHRVRLVAGRVVDAGSDVHDPTDASSSFTGVLRLAAQDVCVAAAAAREMAQTAQRLGWDADPVDLLLVALVRRGVVVGSVSLDPWIWGRGDQAQPVRERLLDIDPAQLRLRRAVKVDDGAWATLAIRRLSRRLTPLALRRGLTPNQVTALSFVVGLAAAGCFAFGSSAAGALGVLGALLLQLSLVVDCVDGEVARYTRTFTPLGAWLDASTDRVKEFACYAGLAVGSGNGASAWLLAAAMLTLQTTRHTTDYTFTAVKDLRETSFTAAPLDQPSLAGPSAGASGAARAVAASQRSNARPAVAWAKKVAHLGIGERWLVLSVGAAVGRPAEALGVLLVLGLLSFGYTAVGRTLRTRAWPAGPSSEREREIVLAQLDPGPLARVATAALPALRQRGRLSGRFLWTLPPALRLGEYSAILLLAWSTAPRAAAAAFTLLLVVAYHHYDELYGVLNRLARQALTISLLGLGVDGRVVLVAALAAAGASATYVGLWVLALALGALFLGYGSLLRMSHETYAVPRRGRVGVAGG